jgi:hypothetical protein
MADEKTCSSPGIAADPAETGETKTGLSRRRSRVRVPSLPSLKVPANRHYLFPDQTQQSGSWPNPVAQTSEVKCLQIARFSALVCVRSHE